MNEKNILFKKALDLAENISYKVSPRPPVAAIVTQNGKIIEEFDLQVFMTGTTKNLFSFLSTNTNFCNITNT